jgi:hypothetical protein
LPSPSSIFVLKISKSLLLNSTDLTPFLIVY